MFFSTSLFLYICVGCCLSQCGPVWSSLWSVCSFLWTGIGCCFSCLCHVKPPQRCPHKGTWHNNIPGKKSECRGIVASWSFWKMLLMSRMVCTKPKICCRRITGVSRILLVALHIFATGSKFVEWSYECGLSNVALSLFKNRTQFRPPGWANLPHKPALERQRSPPRVYAWASIVYIS